MWSPNEQQHLEVVNSAVSGPTPDLQNQKVGWSPTMCVRTCPPGVLMHAHM